MKRSTLLTTKRKAVRSTRPRRAASLKRPGAARNPEPAALQLKSLLVPIDFSECSSLALDYAVAIAGQFGSRIGLVHVLEPAKIFGGLQPPFVESENQATDAAQQRLSQLAQEQIEELIPIYPEVRIGKGYREICAAARQRKSDLIIIGTHGRTGLKHVFLGSVAERVVRFAPCPVLVVGGRGTNGQRKFKPAKILVPVDFSDCSNKAVEYALALAKPFGARLHLVHVLRVHYPVGDYDYFDYAELDASLKLSAEKQLAKMTKLLSGKGVPVEAAICRGRPATEIVKAAEQLGPDLVVISTHGRTGLQHTLLGSTTEEVVRHAACPVLAVREFEQKIPSA